MSDKNQFKTLLNHALSKHWQKLHKSSIYQILDGYKQWKGNSLRYDDNEHINNHSRYLNFLLHKITLLLEGIELRQSDYNEFHRRYSIAAEKSEKDIHILQFSATLGASNKILRSDKKALTRWFDADAITERYIRFQNDDESLMTFAVSRIPTVVEQLCKEMTPKEKLDTFNRFELDKLLLPLLVYKNGDRVKLAAFKSLSQLLTPLSGIEANALPNDVVRYIYRFAIDKAQPMWNQVEALQVIGKINTKQLESIYNTRLKDIEVHDQEDLFFRHYLVIELGKYIDQQPELATFIPLLIEDKSPFVRKAFANILNSLAQQHLEIVLPQLLSDNSEAVQASALLALKGLVKCNLSSEEYLTLLITHVSKSKAAFVTRVGLHVLIPTLLTAKQYLSLEDFNSFNRQIEQLLTQLNTSATLVKVRRWAAQTREQLWAMDWQDKESLVALTQIAPSKSKSLTSKQKDLLSSDEGKRWLATQTESDFGFDICDNKIIRDSKEGFRLWRLLFEWKSPATDKRQNYNHTKGRLFYGLDQVPATNMAEISATKVPGEPLHIEEEGNWRPYLPLVDQVISSLDQGWPTKPLKIYTAEGITHVSPPSSFVARLAARTALTLRFSHYAKLRNWSSEDSCHADSYLAALTKLGFTLSISGHNDSAGKPYPIDTKVAQFFPLAILPPYIASWWNQYQSYFFSVYQNTLSQLGLFLAAMLATFLGLHVKANAQMKSARKSIPLVIGGWGTRGKSGTERLKAALFNGLGMSVLSKTTGCEAMFLYAQRNRPLFEMFLFRPFDKATIWEQVNVTKIAKKLKSDVMLWECMGLTPRYIEILQQQWMKDDIATITNCYPDHEDLQGPAGVDIPKVMMKFVPKNSLLLTTEENMLPYLKLAAKEQNSEIVNVSWLDEGLITSDILERFPYQEHPSNIALVTSLAKELEIDEAYALKEMADRVVPDLGVLKTFPIAHIEHRQLQFINGMSANERFGALGNWQRTGLDKLTLNNSPQTWVMTVINNRDDRVARSKVFAELLVRDVSADKHLLIGNNLTGLMGFIEQSWHIYIDEFLLLPSTESFQQCLDNVKQLAVQLKIPTDLDEVESRLSAMCKGIKIELPKQNRDQLASYNVENNKLEATSAIVAQYCEDYKQFERYQEIVTSLQALELTSINDCNDWQEKMLETLFQWFQSKFVTIDDYYSSGNTINNKLTSMAPPGLLSQVMGMQNIKGTGLDFVYRWQAWERTYNLCKKLYNIDEDVARSALLTLTKVRDFGIVDQELVNKSMSIAKSHRYFQTELCQAQIIAIESQLTKQLEKIAISDQQVSTSLIDKVFDFVEAFLDTGDAVKRRKRANLVMKDLVNEHISQEVAAKELLSLTQKQKGGWLKKSIRSRYRRIKR